MSAHYNSKEIVAKFHTGEFRGDHTSDVCRLYEIGSKETVEDLVNRIFNSASADALEEHNDWIELKLKVPC